MLVLRDRIWLVASAFGLVLACPADAWAYIDPGTGSYLFQLTAAGFLAGIYTFRRYWDVLKARFGGGASTPAAADRPANVGSMPDRQ